MTRYVFAAAAVLWIASSAASLTQSRPEPAAPRAAAPSSAPSSPVASNAPVDVAAHTKVVGQYCLGCHNQRAKAGGLSLDAVDLSSPGTNAEVWEKVVLKLRGGLMPPGGVPRPSEPARTALVSYLENSLDTAAATLPNPGRPSLHRLNRAEYANAIRDLLALDVDPSVLLPPDDSSDGFDNNADVLGVSPALLERYLSAARTVSALAVGDAKAAPVTRMYRVAPDMSQNAHREGLPLGTQGGLAATHMFTADGEYVVKVKLQETALGAIRGLEYENRVEVLLDGQRIHLATVGGDEDLVRSTDNSTDNLNDIGARLTVRVPVTAGPHVLTAAFLGRSAAQGAGRLQQFKRTNVDTTDHTGVPHVEYISVTGPFNPTGLGRTPSRDRIFVCRPGTEAQEAACARRIIETLARRAYRRPVTATEVNRLFGFYEAGRKQGSFDRGVETALRSVLTSPKFIFRAEQDETGPAGTAHAISDIELASRLSFFLWSSLPDDELVEAARRGELRQPAVLERQVKRMLADPRATAMVSNFAGQWLQLRNLRAAIPDQNEFPDFDDSLRQAFRRETELLFQSVLQEDRSVVDLLTADYTFLNERLAEHYRVPNIYGSHFRRVPITEDARRGLLGQGSILLLTSHPDRTSPVLRGKWILDNLLGTPPPPPPANVPALEESAGAAVRTVREQLEAHRKNPACASCHRMMDPLGLALENFDAVGSWRGRDAGVQIDPASELVDGTKIDGVVGLRQALVARRDLFVSLMTEKMLTYAVGRGLDFHDKPVVRAVTREAAKKDYRFSAIVMGVVKSPQFRMRANIAASEGQEARATGPAR